MSLLNTLRAERLARETAKNSPNSHDSHNSLTAALLEDFERHDRLYKVVVPGVDDPLWLVPRAGDAEQLVAAGASRGAIFTARELGQMLAFHHRTADVWRALILVRLAFGAGDVVETRSRARA